MNTIPANDLTQPGPESPLERGTPSQLVKPKIACVEANETYGRFEAEPMEPGFGITIGNTLRRTMLSSLQGAAITWARIEGVQHEFSTVPHMKEDTTEFLLNLKSVRLRAFSDRPARLTLDVSGEGEVKAGDIQPSADYEVVNPELHLATLDSNEANLSVELNAEVGKGYVPAGPTEGLPIGVMPIDAIFTPIRRVNVTVDKTRVGQVGDYDRLTLEIWTDGTITSQEAMTSAARILREQFERFSSYGKPHDMGSAGGGMGIPPEQYDEPIEKLNLSVRAYNCLKRSGISKIGEVLEMSEDDLLAVRNFGHKSLDELAERLTALGYRPAYGPYAREGGSATGVGVAEEEDEEEEDSGFGLLSDLDRLE